MRDGTVTDRLIHRLTGLRKRRVAVRGAWGVADQAVSSLSNFALGFLVVRNVSVEDFGIYSLVFVTYLLFLGTTRAVFGQPFTIRVGSLAYGRRHKQQGMLGGAAVLALLGALLALVASMLVAPRAAGPVAAFAVTMPGLMMQDAYRMSFFAVQRPRDALVNDVVWAVTMFAAAGVVLAAGEASVTSLVLCWGGGATVAAIVGWRQAGARPVLVKGRSFLREYRDLSLPLAGDFWTNQGALQASTYGLGVVASVTTIGVFRTVALLMGPLNLLSNALSVVTLPELARVRHRSMRTFRRVVLAVSGVPFAAALTVGVVLVSIPEAWGVALIGPTWSSLGGVVVPFALARAGGGVASGAIMGCRALEAANGMLRTRLVTSPVTVAATLAGAAMADARGAALGMAAAEWFGALLWWLQYRSAERGWRKLTLAGQTVPPTVASTET